MGGGPQQEAPAGQMYDQICLNISRNEELTAETIATRLSESLSLCLASICLLVTSILPLKAPHTPFSSVQEALLSVLMCAQWRHQTAGAQPPFL